MCWLMELPYIMHLTNPDCDCDSNPVCDYDSLGSQFQSQLVKFQVPITMQVCIRRLTLAATTILHFQTLICSLPIILSTYSNTAIHRSKKPILRL
jgi:hypothetical protein